MTTLRIDNTVHDYDAWKAVFDKFERFRADHGVRAYRVLRRTDDTHDVQVMLDFDSPEEAVEFRGRIEQIWQTPQSQAQIAGDHEAVLLEDVGRHSW
jgi:hypothetical protein